MLFTMCAVLCPYMTEWSLSIFQYSASLDCENLPNGDGLAIHAYNKMDILIKLLPTKTFL